MPGIPMALHCEASTGYSNTSLVNSLNVFGPLVLFWRLGARTVAGVYVNDEA